MTKEELKQYLKDNLRLSLIDDGGIGYYSTGVRYTVQLILEGEVLSEDYITVYTNNG